MTAPKLFISYCWSSPEHQEWVKRLGEELRENAVDVILDIWDLKEGNDANVFMEQMVTDPNINKVIIVIDEQYTLKANSRTGGVGTETQIISAKVYESVKQSKFVAVIAKRNAEGQTMLPAFMDKRKYIDLSDEDQYGVNFETLLRWIYDKPEHEKPELGKKPLFLDEASSLSLGTATTHRRVVDAFKHSRQHAHGALKEYFRLFAENLNRFRLPPGKISPDFDDVVFKNIQQFLPARNELIDVVATVAIYDSTEAVGKIIHRFIENLLPYLDRVENEYRSNVWELENLRFIVHEVFLVCIGTLLKHERFDIAGYILSQQFFVQKNTTQYEPGKMRSFCVIRNHLDILERRNQRLGLNRLSVHADMLRDRCSDSGLSFAHLMQADFVLFIHSAITSVRDDNWQGWWPETLVFRTFEGGSFEMFMRAESSLYFDRIAPVLGIKQHSELHSLVEAINNGKIRSANWHHHRFDPLDLLNYNRLCIRP